jgi:hypothetical protein
MEIGRVALCPSSLWGGCSADFLGCLSSDRCGMTMVSGCWSSLIDTISDGRSRQCLRRATQRCRRRGRCFLRLV